MTKMIVKGNESVAYAAKLARVSVIPAYPITPSTLFPEKISEMIAEGKMDALFLPVESEHSAMSAAIGAAVTGVRTMTATASQGVAFMHEMLFIASGMRLPIVMAVGNRALSAPVNIWADQQDSMSERDAGWLHLYAETNQEALDLALLAFKISENEKVLLPTLIGLDAFVLTHTMEPVDVPEQEEVDAFLGKKQINYEVMDSNSPSTFGAFVFPEHYIEFRYSQSIAMENAKKVIDESFKEFETKFGRKYEKVSKFMVDDADIVLLTMGSMTGTARESVRRMREKGIKVGLIKITVFRPFPKEELINILKKVKLLAVVDRNISVGFAGSIYSEISTIMYGEKTRPKIIDFIIGLGGRDIKVENYEEIVNIAQSQKAEAVNWINVDKDAVYKAEGMQ
ncbi:MAG: transketolase C-terminal domain-containing protein [Thermoplasmata archaeon]